MEYEIVDEDTSGKISDIGVTELEYLADSRFPDYVKGTNDSNYKHLLKAHDLHKLISSSINDIRNAPLNLAANIECKMDNISTLFNMWLELDAARECKINELINALNVAGIPELLSSDKMVAHKSSQMPITTHISSPRILNEAFTSKDAMDAELEELTQMVNDLESQMVNDLQSLANKHKMDDHCNSNSEPVPTNQPTRLSVNATNKADTQKCSHDNTFISSHDIQSGKDGIVNYTVPCPGTFSGKHNEDLNEWKCQMSRYFEITHVPPENRAAFIAYFLNGPPLKTVNGAKDDEKNTESQIFALLERHYGTLANSTIHVSDLMTRKLESNETIYEYYQAMLLGFSKSGLKDQTFQLHLFIKGLPFAMQSQLLVARVKTVEEACDLACVLSKHMSNEMCTQAVSQFDWYKTETQDAQYYCQELQMPNHDDYSDTCTLSQQEQFNNRFDCQRGFLPPSYASVSAVHPRVPISKPGARCYRCQNFGHIARYCLWNSKHKTPYMPTHAQFSNLSY